MEGLKDGRCVQMTDSSDGLMLSAFYLQPTGDGEGGVAAAG